jgi:hypothetical protein
MRLRLAGIALVALFLFTSDVLRTTADPGVCPRSSHLIGQVSVSLALPGPSWWDLIFNGMIAYGLTDPDDQAAYLSGVFGQHFTSLEEARDINVKAVADAFDKNHNGYVCAYDLEGTRAYNTDPLFQFTWFGVGDDKIR